MQELTQVLWYFQHLAFWHWIWIVLLKRQLAQLQSNPLQPPEFMSYRLWITGFINQISQGQGKPWAVFANLNQMKKELRLFPALPSVSLCSCIGFVSQSWPDEGQVFCSLVVLDQTQLEQHPDKSSGTTVKNLPNSSAFTSYPILLCWFHFQLCCLIWHGEAGF